jgi:hypothetical protein
MSTSLKSLALACLAYSALSQELSAAERSQMEAFAARDRATPQSLSAKLLIDEGNLKLRAATGKSVLIETDDGIMDVAARSRRQTEALESLVNGMNTQLRSSVDGVAAAISAFSDGVPCDGESVHVVNGVCVARETVNPAYVRGLVDQYFNASIEARFAELADIEAELTNAESRLATTIDQRVAGPIQALNESLNSQTSTGGLGLSREEAGYSCKAIRDLAGGDPKAMNNGSDVYWIDPNGGSRANAVQVLCDMLTDGGGWTMVASNAHADRTFPRGSSRCNFFLERPGYNGAGRASVNRDFLIGPAIDDLDFTYGRIYSTGAVGRSSDVIDVKWMQNNHRKVNEYNGYQERNDRPGGAIVNLNPIHGSNTASNLGCGGCRSANLDAQRAELSDGSCNSNTNQRTIGGICSAHADPRRGSYIGHGSSEAGAWYGEGSYYNGVRGCQHYDFRIYTTWVR